MTGHGQFRTWRRLLLAHRKRFAAYLRDQSSPLRALDQAARALQLVLYSRIRNAAAAIEFWNCIPLVRRCCDDPETYKRPYAAEAYAYVHFLDRYRRMWVSLERLSSGLLLPLGKNGVSALDIGSGPGPALFAASDFYHEVSTYGVHVKNELLAAQAVSPVAVENTSAMSSLMHAFAECRDRGGPFGATFLDFERLDLPRERAYFLDQNRSTYDDENRFWDDFFNDWEVVDTANRLHRYRLVILSNFLTIGNPVGRYQEALESLFVDLRPGAAVIVLGATGDDYLRIYRRVSRIGRERGLLPVAAQEVWMYRAYADEKASERIKFMQYEVFRYLVDLAGETALQRGAEFPDYWSPLPSPKYKPKFAFRLFRKGRWPTRRTR